MSQTQQFTVNMIRSFTRLKTSFISFYADAPTISAGDPAMFTQEDGLTITSSGNTTQSLVLRPSNRFYNPIGHDTDNLTCSSYQLQWQVSIGSLCFPVYPCKSTAETFYRLKQSLGILPNAFYAIDISYAEFFEKHCTEEFIKETIRPYIEERLNIVLQKLRGKTIYKMGNDNNSFLFLNTNIAYV